MRFLIRLENSSSATPRDRKRLSRLAYEAVKHLGVDVGNLRVSSSAVELDLLLSSSENLEDAVNILKEKIGPILTLRELDTPPPLMGKSEAVRLGIDLFNEERYWESHEALESVWRTVSGSEKDVLQGIILVAVALVHMQKGEDDVTLSVLGRAHEKLGSNSGSYFGIDVDALKYLVEDILSSRSPRAFEITSHEA